MKVGIIALLIAAALGLTMLTGCAGMELGGKLGVYRVDEIKSSQATYRAQTKPLKCLFVDCTMEAKQS